MVRQGPWDRPHFWRLLPDHSVEPLTDVLEWARWMETNDKRVAEDTIGPYWVSTVFLGIDHGFFGRLLVFETMVFDRSTEEPRSAPDLYQDRYETWDEAVAGHAEAVALVRAHVGDLKRA